MALLTLVKEISSAHGKNIHGHTFRIEFEFTGKLQNGMVQNIDFHALHPILDRVLQTIDKKYIDDVIQTRGTAENIAVYLIMQLRNVENLNAVTVFEGKDQFVKIYVSEVQNELQKF